MNDSNQDILLIHIIHPIGDEVSTWCDVFVEETLCSVCNNNYVSVNNVMCFGPSEPADIRVPYHFADVAIVAIPARWPVQLHRRKRHQL